MQLDLLYRYIGHFNVCMLCSRTFVYMCSATQDKCDLANFGDCRCNMPVQAWAICLKVKNRIPGGIYTVTVEAAIFIAAN